MKIFFHSSILLFYLLTISNYSYSQSITGLNSIIDKDEVLKQISSGYSFTEGPAVDKDGRVFFTDQPNDKIYIWDETKGIVQFKVEGERSNGLYFSADQQLVACADFRNRLIKFDLQGTKTVLINHFENKHLNGPNDLWINPNGNIYITDSYYHRTWWPEEQKEEQDKRAVLCLKPNGDLSQVAIGFKMPNGIIGTPDGKTLYISDINEGKIWKYTILPNGELSNKTFFAPEGSDGMTIDNQGNIYLSNKAISVYTKDGIKLGAITVPEQPSNICFAGKNRKTLFITARTSVYKLRMKVNGVQ